MSDIERFKEGQKLYQLRARMALPILVREAKSGAQITYEDLAYEIGMPNPRNLDYPLGLIGRALEELTAKKKWDIPPIQALVINKYTGFPGHGIAGFFKGAHYNKLSTGLKKIFIKGWVSRIKDFTHWHEVLELLGLVPIIEDVDDDIDRAKGIGGGKETEAHLSFKEFIYKHPEVIGVRQKILQKQMEYPLPSGDRLDVFFKCRGLSIGVEVKSHISRPPDILRGIFQCVKYTSVMEAEKLVRKKDRNVRIKVLLVLENQLPKKYLSVKNRLAIEVIDQVRPFRSK